MIVYDNKLFVAGEFTKASGNKGNGIFTFDGNNFVDLGGGFYPAVSKMVIHDGLLFLTAPCECIQAVNLAGLPHLTDRSSAFTIVYPAAMIPDHPLPKLHFIMIASL